MEGGEIEQAGSYHQILAAGETFKKLVNAHKEAMVSTNNDLMNNQASPLEAEIGSLQLVRMQNSIELVVQETGGDITPNMTQLTMDEEKEMRDSRLEPYIDYIHITKGALISVLVVFSQGAFFVRQVATNYWLAKAILDPNIDSGVWSFCLFKISACCSVGIVNLKGHFQWDVYFNIQGTHGLL